MPPTAQPLEFDDTANAVLPVLYSSTDEEVGIWRELLASKKTNTNQGSTVIVLGDNRSGKSSLLSRLDKSDRTVKPKSLLGYRVLHVQNDARDASYAYQLGTAGANLNPSELLQIPVWSLDGNAACASLLKHALPATPAEAIFILTASIDNPNLIHSLKRWANVCTEQAQKHFTKEDLKAGRSQQEKMWQEYVDPVQSQMSTSVVGSFADEHNLLPLDQGTLTENCGVTFMVVITKSDLGKEFTDAQFAKISIQLRKFCLSLGATLVFTSAKETKNIQLLQKYIVHRSFGTAFTSAAQVIERESIFVPAGWDGEKKIDIIRESIPDVDSALEPTRDKLRPVAKEQLIEAEEDQAFLKKLMDILATSTTTAAPKPRTMQEEPTDKDSPLANFFSNLLNKDKPSKVSSPSTVSQPMDAAATQAQLDRLLKSAQSPKPQPRDSDA
ncbi:Dynein light intermediate chain [Caenorhabditis elegans]|uniref:Dynein light intermediate chain n=1 Tax=Caenorhabditis elegans TaxID=6239 RepID=G5ECK7_CAEEL|nr:Dynein light intermediate chain [Caenorhabditis elegans]CAC42262.2 Dynein light intermediate chain [Caenorhabditis elegans]|eukprot:NP_502519.2 Dynein Light Intermediate chain [Caenorhabditis elegans]